MMLKILIGGLLLLAAASVASAHDDETPLRLNSQELTIIGNALGQRPYNEVRPLIDKLQAQINDHAKGKDAAAQKPAEQKGGEPQ